MAATNGNHNVPTQPTKNDKDGRKTNTAFIAGPMFSKRKHKGPFMIRTHGEGRGVKLYYNLDEVADVPKEGWLRFIALNYGKGEYQILDPQGVKSYMVVPQRVAERIQAQRDEDEDEDDEDDDDDDDDDEPVQDELPLENPPDALDALEDQLKRAERLRQLLGTTTPQPGVIERLASSPELVAMAMKLLASPPPAPPPKPPEPKPEDEWAALVNSFKKSGITPAAVLDALTAPGASAE